MAQKPRGALPYCLLGAAAGLLLILIPGLFHHPSFSPWVLAFASIKHSVLLDTLLIFSAGFLWGYFKGWPNGVAAAFCQTAFLPVLAVLEIVQDSTSHNLWPLEFIMYGFMGGVGAFGAALGLLPRKTAGTATRGNLVR